MRIRSFLFLIVSICVCQTTVFAQKTKKVSGTYIYVVPETQSFSQAKETAIQRAKTQILADTFGTIMDVSTTTAIGNEGTQLHALSNSQVRGEWIETIGEPQLTRLFDNDQLAIKVEITGKVREIVAATSEFTAQVLKAPDPRFAQTTFHSEEDLFLLFQAPEDGYLTVYLYDGNGTVYVLLPYPQQSVGVFPVKGGKQYIFFSPDNEDGVTSKNAIERLILQTSSEMEINRLYVIYSPNRYVRAVDFGSESGLRELRFGNFQQWLSRIRSEDLSLSVKTIDLTILK